MQNQHVHNENLYEIPNCTICLNQLTQQLANLNCGHVFHITCITQHFQYRGTCPNCQKRSHEKEIRPVVFQLQKNNQAAQLMRNLLGNLSVQQKQQVQTLFKQVQIAAQTNQKLTNKANEAQKQLKKATNQLNDTKTSYNRVKVQSQTLKKDTHQLKKVIQHFQNEKKKLEEQNFQLRITIQNYKQKQSQYEQLRKYKKIMYENSQTVINYKNQLQSNRTSHQQMSKRFFQMILIKNLQVIKLKNKLESYPQKIIEKDQQIKKLKSIIEKEKKQIKDIHQKRNVEKKKYDQLKIKYRNLVEKYKAKCEELSDQQNYQDSMLSRPSFPLLNTSVNNKASNCTVLNNSNDQNSESNIPFGETKIIKKPSSNIFDIIIEEEPLSNNLNVQGQKKTIQQSLSTFITQKSVASNSYGTYGGMIAKKKADDKKPLMRNLFS